ncbi:MAG: SEL1-like repeat protein, partial [Burkholderiales bacterium]|nr:SEL1-like repeat protein [Burkholderiales bacterium]
EQLPALIKRMQKPVLGGGFTSLDACIKAFEALEIDKRALAINEPPQTSGVFSMQPSPVLHPSPLTVAPVAHHDDFAPVQLDHARRERRAEAPSGRGKFVGIGLGLIMVAVLGAALLRSRDQHASVTPPEPGPTTVDSNTTSAPISQANAVPSATSVPTVATTPVAATSADNSGDAAQAPDSTALAGLSLDELRAAAQHGDPAAQTQLGLRYRKGQGIPADNQKAVEWYRKAADQNHAEGQAYLGFMLMTGRGIKRDYNAAAHYSKLAAEQGNPTGEYNLGLLYLSGRGVPADKIAGYRWIKKAATQDAAAAARLEEVKHTLTPAELAQAEAAQ